jgi:hypothetical protein
MPSTKARRTLMDALKLCGYSVGRYDDDAIFGYLQTAGIHLMDEVDVTRAMFEDRCDFECTICHPDEGDDDECA